jgi:predicted Fe-Mo cluster-binding NifX family protein
MKIAVSATGTGLDSSVDPSFERCAYFVIVDTDSSAAKATANPFREAVDAAQTDAAQWVLAQGVQVLMTGRCGPPAATVLANADICVIEGVFGNVGAVTASVQGVVAPTTGGAGFGPRQPGRESDGGLCRWVGGWRGQGHVRWRGLGPGMGRAGRG